MLKCAVRNCDNTSSTNKNGLLLHPFPANPPMVMAWGIAINRELYWKPTATCGICSEHFTEGDYIDNESGCKELSVEAVPSVNLFIIPGITPYNGPAAVILPTDCEHEVRHKQDLLTMQAMVEQKRRNMELNWLETRQMKYKVILMEQMIDYIKKYQSRHDG